MMVPVSVSPVISRLLFLPSQSHSPSLNQCFVPSLMEVPSPKSQVPSPRLFISIPFHFGLGPMSVQSTYRGLSPMSPMWSRHPGKYCLHNTGVVAQRHRSKQFDSSEKLDRDPVAWRWFILKSNPIVVRPRRTDSARNPGGC